MRTGYRLAAPIALYNYRANRMANFGIGNALAGVGSYADNALMGIGTAGKNAWQGLGNNTKNVWNGLSHPGQYGNYIDEAAQGIGRAYGQGIQNVGIGSLGITNRLPPVRMPGAQTGDALGVAGINTINAGKQLATGGRYAKWVRRGLGYGTLGAGALGVGAAGYAGYNALTNQ